MTPDKEASPGTITRLLHDARGGDATARDLLLAATLEPLKAIARNHLAHYRAGPVKGETSLVQDAVLRLLERQKLDADNRRQFYFVMKRAMRDVLIEHFKRKDSKKQGGGWRQVPFMEISAPEVTHEVTVGELEDALDALEVDDPDCAHTYMLVEMYGSTLQGAADSLGRTFSQVRDDCDYARSWLKRRLTRSSSMLKSAIVPDSGATSDDSSGCSQEHRPRAGEEATRDAERVE